VASDEGWYLDRAQCHLFVYCNKKLLFVEFLKGREVIMARILSICAALKGTNAYIEVKYRHRVLSKRQRALRYQKQKIKIE